MPPRIGPPHGRGPSRPDTAACCARSPRTGLEDAATLNRLTHRTVRVGRLHVAYFLALWGTRLGVITPAIVAAALKATPKTPGLASGASNTARQPGGTPGIAHFAAIAGRPTPQASPRKPPGCSSLLRRVRARRGALLGATLRERTIAHVRQRPSDPEGPKGLIDLCRTRPNAPVAAEIGIFQSTASKWVNRHCRRRDPGLSTELPRPGAGHSHKPAGRLDRKQCVSLTSGPLEARVRVRGRRIRIGRPHLGLHPVALGLNYSRLKYPNSDSNRTPASSRPTAGHVVHIDVKQLGRIPEAAGSRTP